MIQQALRKAEEIRLVLQSIEKHLAVIRQHLTS